LKCFSIELLGNSWRIAFVPGQIVVATGDDKRIADRLAGRGFAFTTKQSLKLQRDGWPEMRSKQYEQCGINKTRIGKIAIENRTKRTYTA
jgi:hypothetical protein